MISWTGNSLMSGGPCICTLDAAIPGWMLDSRCASKSARDSQKSITPRAAVDRPGRVKQQPRPRGAIRVDLVVCSVELFLCHTWKLDSDTDCQDDSLPRVTGQRDPKAREQPLPE